MSKWKQYTEDNEFRPRGRKVNKNVVCKKNKIGGGKFGPHVYENNSDICSLCRHVDKSKKVSFTFSTNQKEEINNE